MQYKKQIILATSMFLSVIVVGITGYYFLLEKGDAFLVLGTDTQVRELKEYAKDDIERLPACMH